MKRLFVGIPVSTALADDLLHLQEGFNGGDRLRLVPEEHLHATLCFLGKTEESALPLLHEGFQSIADSTHPFSLSWLALRNIQKESAGMSWLEMSSTPAWDQLVEQVRSICKAHMSKDFSFAKQIPHITLTRWKGIEPQLPDIPLPQKPFAVDRICLYESHQDPGGSRYTVLDTFMLQ